MLSDQCENSVHVQGIYLWSNYLFYSHYIFTQRRNFLCNQNARVHGVSSFKPHSYSLTGKLEVNSNLQTEFDKFAHQTGTAESSHAKQERLFTYVRPADQAFLVPQSRVFFFFLFALRSRMFDTDVRQVRSNLAACAWREKCVRRTDARGRENNGVGRYDTLRHVPDDFPDRAVIWRRGASAARRVQVNGKNPV